LVEKVEIGKPSLGGHKLAYAIYGAAFTRADAAGRKRMVDRCGQAVKRHEARLGRNHIVSAHPTVLCAPPATELCRNLNVTAHLDGGYEWPKNAS
jgi:hypothetical protein